MFIFSFNEGVLYNWTLIIFGTATDPLKDNPHVAIPKVTTSPPDTTSPPETKSTTEQNSDKETGISRGR